MKNSKIKVLFIGGMGRSGTTILANILGESPGLFSAGEINYIWQRGVIENRLCGCGERFKDCAIWRQILLDAFDEINLEVASKMSRTFKSLVRTRYFLNFLLKSRSKPSAELKDYIDILSTLYKSINRITGCEVIIDSSKFPTYGAVLNLIPEIDLYVVHVVRDPRAVAFSWRRKKTYDTGAQPSQMPQQSILRSSLFWLVWNFLLGTMSHKLADKYMLVKYEDFVSSPNQALENIFSLLKHNSRPGPKIHGNEISIGVNHMVSGNPSRFKSGAVEIMIDDEWMRQMSFYSKMSAALVTLPYMLRYNYFF